MIDEQNSLGNTPNCFWKHLAK
ncbi:MAG: hypothetical protein DBX59_06670 [Bacillota bacterium]|nr:MAG: hypothetical protein DBX59_06670 [Bacillota bacterium]